MNTKQQYCDFLFLLTDDAAFSEQLSGELAECDADPAGFYARYKENHFTNRGMNAAGNSEQTLCYLLDVLEEKNLLWELDWKADAESMNEALEEMSGGKIRDLLSEEDEEEAEGMFELIETAEELLEDNGYSLLEFPIDSDSHAIALIPAEKQESLQNLLDELFQ